MALSTHDLEALSDARLGSRDGSAREIRIAAGLSQEEVASVCGVTAAAVCRWETGRRVPAGEPALKYARLLAALSKRRKR